MLGLLDFPTQVTAVKLTSIQAKLVTTSKCASPSKLVPTSKQVPLILLKLLIDDTTSNTSYHWICDDKIDMVLNFPSISMSLVTNDLKSLKLRTNFKAGTNLKAGATILIKADN